MSTPAPAGVASPPSNTILRAVLIAAGISLVVTLVRLVGELMKWAPSVFDTSSGGGGSLLGITWLVPVFGFWFGRKLAQNGHRPKSTKKALVWCFAGMVVAFIGFVIAFSFIGPTAAEVKDGAKVTADQWQLIALIGNCGALVGGLLLVGGWARAWVTLAFYAILARTPIIVIQCFAVTNAWDTHFSKGPPGMPPEIVLFALTIAQSVFWPFGFTVLFGGLFAVLGAATVKSAAA